MVSHYVKRVSAYRDAEALVVALTKCGVAREAIIVLNNGEKVAVDKEKTGTYLSTVFTMAKADRSRSSFVEADPYRWPKTLIGISGTASADAWLNRVRMEYDFETQRKKASLLGQRVVRIEQNNKIYAVIKA